jgi:hypothetical protein
MVNFRLKFRLIFSSIILISSDHKSNKQINAAVDAFWSQNMRVIESPATNAASVYKARMLKLYKNNNSNFNSPS